MKNRYVIIKNGNEWTEETVHSFSNKKQAIAFCKEVDCLFFEDKNESGLSVLVFDTKTASIVYDRSITRINKVSDSILDTVQRHFGGKYTTHQRVRDNNFIDLRIADHSGNSSNNCRKTVSIVIANENKTMKKFYTSGNRCVEYFFDSSNTAEEIIEFIEEEILF